MANAKGKRSLSTPRPNERGVRAILLSLLLWNERALIAAQAVVRSEENYDVANTSFHLPSEENPSPDGL